MIAITGAYGFIGSCLVRKLNEQGIKELLLIDDFDREVKACNLEGKKFITKILRTAFIDQLHQYADQIHFIFHLGARTDTTELDVKIFDELNLEYSKAIWNFCTVSNIPLVYASSAATYGDGENGYADNHDIIADLKPLNPYGKSKNDFDKWVLEQSQPPPFWAGLKFFNVYGPNEYHKGRMASVVFHAFQQIKSTGAMKLFRSHRSDVKDGHQQRDFVYVKDVVEVCYFFYISHQQTISGLYNVGTGEARSFLDLTNNIFTTMGLSPNISFIDTPIDIRTTYQYFTEAQIHKLRSAGYNQPFYSLEKGIEDYVANYLDVPDGSAVYE